MDGGWRFECGRELRSGDPVVGGSIDDGRETTSAQSAVQTIYSGACRKETHATGRQMLLWN